MSCLTVREMLAVIRPDSRDAAQPEFASEMMHLEQCAECRAFFEAQQRADQQLGRAVRAVAIPVNLKARLLEQLAAASVAPMAIGETPTLADVTTTAPATLSASIITPDQPSDPRTVTTVQPSAAKPSWTRRQLLAIAGALLVTVLGSWLLMRVNRLPVQSVEELVALSHGSFPADSPNFQKSFLPELPGSEIRIPTPHEVAGAKSLRFQKREIGAAIPYLIRLAARRNPVTVMLVVIDMKKVQVPGLNTVPTSFQAASVSYPPPKSYATRVWHVGESLYVCYVISNDPEVLGTLKRQSATT